MPLAPCYSISSAAAAISVDGSGGAPSILQRFTADLSLLSGSSATITIATSVNIGPGPAVQITFEQLDNLGRSLNSNQPSSQWIVPNSQAATPVTYVLLAGCASIRLTLLPDGTAGATFISTTIDVFCIGDAWEWGYTDSSLPIQFGPPLPAVVTKFARITPQLLANPNALNGGPDVLALTTDGDVWAFTTNADGLNGDGTTTIANPRVWHKVIFPLPSFIIDIGAGPHNAYALDDQQNLWAWGSDGIAMGEPSASAFYTPFITHDLVIQFGAGQDFVVAFVGLPQPPVIPDVALFDNASFSLSPGASTAPVVGIVPDDMYARWAIVRRNGSFTGQHVAFVNVSFTQMNENPFGISLHLDVSDNNGASYQSVPLSFGSNPTGGHHGPLGGRDLVAVNDLHLFSVNSQSITIRIRSDDPAFVDTLVGLTIHLIVLDGGPSVDYRAVGQLAGSGADIVDFDPLSPLNLWRSANLISFGAYSIVKFVSLEGLLPAEHAMAFVLSDGRVVVHGFVETFGTTGFIALDDTAGRQPADPLYSGQLAGRTPTVLPWSWATQIGDVAFGIVSYPDGPKPVDGIGLYQKLFTGIVNVASSHATIAQAGVGIAIGAPGDRIDMNVFRDGITPPLAVNLPDFWRSTHLLNGAAALIAEGADPPRSYVYTFGVTPPGNGGTDSTEFQTSTPPAPVPYDAPISLNKLLHPGNQAIDYSIGHYTQAEIGISNYGLGVYVIAGLLGDSGNPALSRSVSLFAFFKRGSTILTWSHVIGPT